MNEIQTIPEATIISKIYEFRGKKVMIDRDLADLYDVETRVLNQAVKRNQKRFPEDFMFQMTTEEMNCWKSQIVISNNEKMGLRKPPLAITEQAVAMWSSVLNSDRAIMDNIRIIRVFRKIRELLSTQKDILRKFEEIEKNDLDQDKKISLIFEYLKQLEKARQTEVQQKNRPKIGFQSGKKD
jgi:hypothetical protein